MADGTIQWFDQFRASVFVLSSGSTGPIAIIAVNPNHYEGPPAMQEDFSCKEAA